MINHYFQSGVPMGIGSEQDLVSDLIIECLKIYGFETYYLPRQEANRDMILNEDPLNYFSHSYPIEMYLESIQGFEGEGQLLTRFGLEIRDSASFIVAKRRWDQLVGRSGKARLQTRPAEGDIVYFPLTKSFFEIRKVHDKDPFFQVGKLHVFRLECELMQYSSERFSTGREEIDKIPAKHTIDQHEFGIFDEASEFIVEEGQGNTPILDENYDLEEIDKVAQNDELTKEAIDILDFDDKNPFGDVV